MARLSERAHRAMSKIALGADRDRAALLLHEMRDGKGCLAGLLELFMLNALCD